uniref:Uncharacterized protein n=1 Tax=Ananas comosus var. bracteatus TaxID=296719 RepID=A0A6V7Q0E8_ANACO|nr:unnamed protein product [Ananas comosus var. bracteatus]
MIKDPPYSQCKGRRKPQGLKPLIEKKAKIPRTCKACGKKVHNIKTCKEAGRGSVSVVLDAVPELESLLENFSVDRRCFGSFSVQEHRNVTRLDSLEPRLRDESIGSLLARFGEADFRDAVSQVPASTFRILARSLRRSVGIQRNLGHWIRDFETKLQNPCLLNLDKVSLVVFNAFFAAVFWADFVILSVIGFTSSQQENRGLRRTSEGSFWIRATFFAARSCLRVGLALHGLVIVEVAGQSQRGRDGCIHSPGDGYAYSPDWIGSDLTFPTVG